MTAARLFLLKRVAFKYEDEIRVILIDKRKSDKNGVGIEYKMDATELIKQILLDPSVDDYTYLMISKVLEESYGFRRSENGLRRVMKSSLYSKPEIATIYID